MKTKKLLFGLGLALLGTFANAQNGLDSIIVEKYYISNAADSTKSMGTLPVGSVTYRIYADMLPGYKFQALFGVPTHELKISTSTKFFNNEDRGATTPNGISKTYMGKNTNNLDSWFSVGAACTGNLGVLKTEDDGVNNLANSDNLLQNKDSLAGIPLTTQDGMIAGTPEAVTFVGLSTELNIFDATSRVGSLFSTTNGSIASLNGSVGPTATNRVLIGQFTTNGTFGYELNVQIGTPTGGIQQYVSKNPVGNEIQIPSMMGGFLPEVSATVSIKDYNSSGPSYNIYPNPAKDRITIEIVSASKQNSADSYTIYTILGNEILHKTLGAISGNHVENVDISSLETGLYFIQLSVDGAISTKKIFKN